MSQKVLQKQTQNSRDWWKLEHRSFSNSTQKITLALLQHESLSPFQVCSYIPLWTATLQSSAHVHHGCTFGHVCETWWLTHLCWPCLQRKAGPSCCEVNSNQAVGVVLWCVRMVQVWFIKPQGSHFFTHCSLLPQRHLLVKLIPRWLLSSNPLTAAPSLSLSLPASTCTEGQHYSCQPLISPGQTCNNGSVWGNTGTV